jgi:linoleate 9S-lipoxygenase
LTNHLIIQNHVHGAQFFNNRASSDPLTESRVSLDKQIYVPCDERVGTAVIAAPSPPNQGGHFKSIAEIYGLVGLDDFGKLDKAKQFINNGATTPKLPVPQVISGAVCIIALLKTQSLYYHLLLRSVPN